MKRELFRQREEAVRTNHPDIPLAVPELSLGGQRSTEREAGLGQRASCPEG